MKASSGLAVRMLGDLAGVLVAACCIPVQPAHAAEDADLRTWQPAAEVGRDLYFGARVFKVPARLGGAELPLPVAACSGCHGANGRGTREAVRASADIRQAAMAGRGPTDPASFLRAVVDGVGADGRSLARNMPRYVLDADERASLLAFWPWLGDETAPVRGVFADELFLGVDLDRIASQAAREEVIAGLRDALQRVNEAGGLHGRQVRLATVNEDAADVFALVGSAPGRLLSDSLAARRLPSLAGLSPAMEEASGSDWSTPLLPSLRQQARDAARWLADSPAGCRRWLYDPSGWLPDDELPSVGRGEDAVLGDGDRELCVLSLAPALEIDAVRASWKSRGIPVARLIELAWLRSGPLAEPGLVHQVILPTPKAVVDHATQGGRSLWYALGEASARTAIEALARSGRVLQPEDVLGQMRTLAGFEPVPGAALAYTRGSAHGWNPERWSASASGPPSLNRGDSR